MFLQELCSLPGRAKPHTSLRGREARGARCPRSRRRALERAPLECFMSEVSGFNERSHLKRVSTSTLSLPVFLKDQDEFRTGICDGHKSQTLNEYFLSFSSNPKQINLPVLLCLLPGALAKDSAVSKTKDRNYEMEQANPGCFSAQIKREEISMSPHII